MRKTRTHGRIYIPWKYMAMFVDDWCPASIFDFGLIRWLILSEFGSVRQTISLATWPKNRKKTWIISASFYFFAWIYRSLWKGSNRHQGQVTLSNGGNSEAETGPGFLWNKVLLRVRGEGTWDFLTLSLYPVGPDIGWSSSRSSTVVVTRGTFAVWHLCTSNLLQNSIRFIVSIIE